MPNAVSSETEALLEKVIRSLTQGSRTVTVAVEHERPQEQGNQDISYDELI